MEKINVSKERCIGCGACVAIDAEHFEFDDDGKSECISNENLDSGNLVNAIESCPTSAIEKVEEHENAESTNCDNEECDCEGCDCANCDCSDECDCQDCECDDCESQNEIETEEN